MYFYNNCKLKSHSEHLLVEHLTGVSNVGLDLAMFYNLDDHTRGLIKLIGMCHDFGKATKYFQKKLNGGTWELQKQNELDLANHGLISALFGFWVCNKLYTEEDALKVFLVIKKHHGNMSDMYKELSVSNKVKQLRKVAKQGFSDDCIKELNMIYEEFEVDVKGFLNWLLTEDLEEVMDEYVMLDDITGFSTSYEYIKLYISVCELYSILLTGDKMHLIGYSIKDKEGIDLDLTPKTVFNKTIIDCYKEDLISKLKANNKASGLFFDLKQLVSKEVKEVLECDDRTKGIYSLNVPTGVGKTLLAYEVAFELASRNSEFNTLIVYCLPYMSIIDQNYNVLKEILEFSGIDVTESKLLKYHSLAEIEYSISQQYEDTDITAKNKEGNELYLKNKGCTKCKDILVEGLIREIKLSDYDALFCRDNWQSNIVCTTFVQLFDTLFKASKNKVGSRFHRLRGSVLVLDELQCINPKYFKVLEEMLRFLVKEWGIRIVLVSATMPLLFEDNEKVELVPNKEKYFNMANRIQIFNHSDKDMKLSEFKDEMLDLINLNTNKSVLIVLNTVNSAKEVYRHIKSNTNRNVIYLSTEIYPILRLKLIDKIRNSQGNENYIVVSTQLVEAGVDIDMDIVVRDFSTLDSINQVGGRANRAGLKGLGELHLYYLVNEDHNNHPFCSYVYPQNLLALTKTLLTGKLVIEEKDIFGISQQYFRGVRKIVNSKDTYKDFNDYIENLKFETMRKKFKLIDDVDYGRVDFVICIDNECKKLVKCLENNIDLNEKPLTKLSKKALFKKLSGYTISAKEYDKEGNSVIGVRVLEDYGLLLVNEVGYDTESGLIRDSEGYSETSFL